MNKKELKKLCKELKVKETGMYSKGYNIGINSVLSALLSQGNPPLKFEELKEGMWVWVKDMHQYQQIRRVFIDESVFIKGHGIRMVETNDRGLGYEENRFYRYEVKEDE